MTARVLFYVQHLLGIGHLVRAGRIVDALAEAGFAVDLVLGGLPVPGLPLGRARLTQLPPVRTTPDFSALLHPDGRLFTEADRAARRDQLLGTFDAAVPDVLIIEAFPFGRRQMDFELLPLLERARARRPPPLVAVSVRDILQRGRKPKRAEETAAIVERSVDLVLVHGDPALAQLSDSFPLASRFARKTVHTGLVGPDPRHHPPIAEHAVVVSAGGGAVGERLIRAAIAARACSPLAEARWLIVTGPNMPADLEVGIRQCAAAGLEIVRFAPDLFGRLRGATLSVSQAGYNTVADLLAARCRSVLVPFAAGGETEQAERARLLSARGLAVVVDEVSLDPGSLAGAMRRALDAPRSGVTPDLGGAAGTAAVLRRRIAGFH